MNKCERCKQIFKNKRNLDQHSKRKNPCKEVPEPEPQSNQEPEAQSEQAIGS
jgi:hypothetical protein